MKTNQCPELDRLASLLNNRVQGTDRTELELHVDGCRDCQRSLEALTDAIDWGLEPSNAASMAHQVTDAEIVTFAVAEVTAGPPAPIGQRVDHGFPRVDGYQLVAELGRGGMGVVYKAHHVRLHRTCALKMILSGAYARPEDVARFRAEAEAIARLEHPHIVQIRNIGETDGLPFFELEFLNGGSLERRLDGTPWPARRAARLVEQIAAGVAEAHRLGIVHRDLKPANVLLTDDETPKVGDFGLAKILDSESALTQSEAVMGSPSYMAPEQAQGSTKTAGAAADIYALGAILYELITGRPPFRGPTVLETLEQVKTAEAVPPSRLVPGLSRDMETICLKCLQKQPDRRYASALALADDLQRFQDGRPILARPVGSLERAWRWYCRNRLLAGATTAAAASILILAIGATVSAVVLLSQLDRTRRAEAEASVKAESARRSATEAEAVRNFLENDLLAAARPVDVDGGLGKDATIRQAVDASRWRIAAAFENQPAVEAAVRNTLGLTYFYLGEPALAIAELERACAIRESRFGPNNADTLQSRNNLAMAYLDAARVTEAIGVNEDTFGRRRSLLGPDDQETLNSANNLAQAYAVAGRADDAISLHKETLERRTSKLGPIHRETLASRNNLAQLYLETGRIDLALPMFQKTLSVQTSTVGPDHLDTLLSRNNLAQAFLAAGQVGDAIKLHEKTVELCTSKLGADHLHTLQTRNNLAEAYRADGRIDKVIAMHKGTLDLRTGKLGADHPDTLESRNNLALAYTDAGRSNEAIAMHRETLRIAQSKLGLDHPNTLLVRNNLAYSLLLTGRVSEGLAMSQETLKLARTKLGLDHPTTLGAGNNLARAYQLVGRTADAITLWQEILPGVKKAFASGHSNTLTVMNRLATAQESLGDWSGSLALRREVVASRRRSGPAARAALAADLGGLGNNLLRQHAPADAESTLRECLAICEATQPDDWSTFYARSLLGASLKEQGKYAEAEALLVGGYQGLESHKARIPPPLRNRLNEAGGRVIELYRSWRQPATAARWSKKLGIYSDLPADPFR